MKLTPSSTHGKRGGGVHGKRAAGRGPFGELKQGRNLKGKP